MNTNAIRVLIADDQSLVRGGFRALLDAEPDIEVVGEASTGRQAVELARQTAPDVILMDIRMPDGDGLTATGEILADPTLNATRVIVVTTFDMDEYIVEAVALGAAGFLVKDTEPAELIRAVRVVADGDALLSPSVTRTLLAKMSTLSRTVVPARDIGALTDREREVVTLAGHGLTNAEIAERLVLSPLTAKTHISRAMTKLGVRDRAQLVVIAYESGLVRPGWS